MKVERIERPSATCRVDLLPAPARAQSRPWADDEIVAPPRDPAAARTTGCAFAVLGLVFVALAGSVVLTQCGAPEGARTEGRR